MSTIVKVFLGFLALVVAAILIVAIFVATFDINNYKDRIVESFAEETGRELQLGDMALTIYPWLGISVNDFAIGNAPGFGVQPMLEASRAQLRVKLLPLSRRQYEIDTLRLHGARVRLMVDEAGMNNWADLTAETDDNAGARQDSSLLLANIIIGGVDVQDAGLIYEDLTTGNRIDITDLSLAIDELVYNSPINLSMAMDAAMARPALESQVSLEGTLNYNLDREQFSLSKLSLQADISGQSVPNGSTSLFLQTTASIDLQEDTLSVPDLTLEFLDADMQVSIQGEQISSQSPRYQTSLNMAGDDMAQIFQIFEVEPLATQLAELDDQSYSLLAESLLEPGDNRLEINDFSASLLEAELQGNLLVSDTRVDNLIANGAISGNGPNLPLLVEVIGQLSGGGDSVLAQAGRELRQIEQQAFAFDSAFDINLGTGNINVPRLQADALGAEIAAQLQAQNVGADDLQVAGNLAAEGEDLPLLLQIGGWIQGGVESPVFQFGSSMLGDSNSGFILRGEFDANLQAGDVQISDMSMNALGLNLSGNLNATRMNARNGSVTGLLQLQGDELGALLAALEQSELGEVLESVSMDVQISGSRNNLRLSPALLELQIAGIQSPGTVTALSINAETLLNLEQETLEIDSFSASGLGLDLSGQVRAESIFDAPVLSGHLELADVDLRNFLLQLNQPLPATSDPNALRRVGLSVDFTGSQDAVALQQLAMQLDDSRLTGEVAVTDMASQATEFALEIDQINLDRYLGGNESATPGPSEETTTQLPNQQLRQLNIQGSLQVGQLTASGLTLSDLDVSVNAADGNITLAPFTTSLYEGFLDGNLQLSVANAEPRINLDADLSQVNLEPLVQDLMDASYLSGRGNVQISLSGSGADIAAIKASLSGNGRIELAEGVLQGVDVGNALRQVETMIRARQAGDLQRGEQTPFDEFSSTLAINAGVVSTNDLLLQAPGFQVTGRGTLLNLADETIAFDMVTSVDSATAEVAAEEYDIGGYSLPIACNGSLQSPRCVPDAGEILRQALAREVQQRVGDLLQRAIGVEESPQVDDSATPATEPETETQQEQTPVDPREGLLNRALERIFR